MYDFNPAKAYIKQYALYFKLAALLVLLALTVHVTARYQQSEFADEKATLTAKVTKAEADKKEADGKVATAAAMLNEQTELAKQAKAMEEAFKKHARETEELAIYWRKQYLAKNKQYDQKIDAASRKPDCAILFDPNILKVCGL